MTGLGTWLYTKCCGKYVGADDFGNSYYTEKLKPTGRRRKRWVIFNGKTEASKVPPEWHAWLHYTVDEPIAKDPAKQWQVPYVPNLTGTENAYLPPGHDSRGGQRAKASGDYQAWRPE